MRGGGSFIAIVVLAAYIGFEAYAIRKVSHRTEPAYIYQLLIEANAATTLCNDSALAMRARFSQTLGRVRKNYGQDLVAASTDASGGTMTPDKLEEYLLQKDAAALQSVEKAIAEKGCTDPAMKAHFQRYRIYARKTR